LCGTAEAAFYHRDKQRDYYQCGQCQLVFVPSRYFLTPAEEKTQYDWHENNPEDEGYRKFLSRLFTPLQSYLQPGSDGLDFGSGPGPTLSLMLAEAGYRMAIYDLFYATDTAVFNQQYDFITATAVLELLRQPQLYWDRWIELLRPGGVLGVMTKLVYGRSDFATWHYKNDPTHICFYSTDTFNWAAQHWGLTIVFAEKDVIIFRK
jgi:hypothetical protein